MNHSILNIYEPCFMQSGFYFDNSNHTFGKDMLCYTLHPEYGKGHYWLYPYKNLFCISIKNFEYNSDFYIKYPRQNALNISYMSSASGEEFNPPRSLSCSCLYSRVDDNSVFKAKICKEVPIRSTGIEIMPAYYDTYLKEHYQDQYPDPRTAFNNIENINDFPELMVVFNQLYNFKGDGLSAKLYYNSKVAEVISLVFEKNLSLTTSRRIQKVHISTQDKEFLNRVIIYLDKHYNKEVDFDKLVQIACMGSTKLKSSFKHSYNCTISEYIIRKRISTAADLLVNTDYSIQQISQTVGYRHHINFTKSFKKITGYLPSDYRKSMRDHPGLCVNDFCTYNLHRTHSNIV